MFAKKIAILILWPTVLALTLVSNSLVADHGHEKDRRIHKKAAVIKVYLNSRSFQNLRCPLRKGKTYKCGFPKSFTQQAIKRAVRKTIDNWMQLSGVNLTVVFADTDSKKKVAAAPNEIVIRAATSHLQVFNDGSQSPVAVTTYAIHSKNDQTVKGITLYFYRQDSNGKNFNWEVFPDHKHSGEIFASTLTHEMGHAFGLEHNNDKTVKTAMQEKTNYYMSFGPYTEDISDIVDLYGKRNPRKIRTLLSTDQGLSWRNRSSNIPSHLTSTMPLTVNRDDDRMILFFTEKNKKPSWSVGDRFATNFSNGMAFGGERSFYGVAGHGYDDEYLMAWVDHTEGHRIRIIRLTNKTKKRVFADPPPSSAAIGTPAVHKLAKNTWILTYPKLDKLRTTGRIVSRISTNDGRSWGKEIELYKKENWRAIRGVSVTSDGPDEIAISFAHATNALGKDTKRSRAGSIVTITAHLDRNNRLKGDQWRYNVGVRTVNEPSITRTGSKFIMGYRDQDSELISRNASKMPGWWKNKRVVLRDNYFVGPAMTARRNSDYVFMFYMNE